MNITKKEGRKLLDCSFAKFGPLRFPVLTKTWVYTYPHQNTQHNHDFPQMWFCLDGMYDHKVEDKIYRLGKGSVVIIPPGIYHSIMVQPGDCAKVVQTNLMYDIFLNIPPERYINTVTSMFLQPFAKELGYSQPLIFTPGKETQNALEKYTSWFASLGFGIHGADTGAEICDKLEEMFTLPEFALPEQYREKAIQLAQSRLLPIVRVLRYMNQHYPEKIAEEDLVKEAAICRANLYRWFKQFTGYTCSNYLQWMRTKHVFIYLTYTTYPISYISDICGFTNPAYMSQLFSKFIGSKPRDFRAYQRDWLEKNPDKRPDKKMAFHEY